MSFTIKLFSIITQSIVILLMITGCSQSIDLPVYDTIDQITYNEQWDMFYVAWSWEKVGLYKNHALVSSVYDDVYMVTTSPWINSVEFPLYLIYTASWQSWIVSEQQMSAMYDSIIYLNRYNDIPYFEWTKWDEYSILRWTDPIYTSNNRLLLRWVSPDGKPLIQDGMTMVYDNIVLTGAVNAKFYKDSILAIYKEWDTYKLIYNNSILYTWQDTPNLVVSMTPWLSNVLEFLYIEDFDQQPVFPTSYMQYIIDGVPHERTELLNEVHVPFFSGSLAIYAFKKNNLYYLNTNNRIFWPYIDYPEIHIFAHDTRFLSLGTISGGYKELVIDSGIVQKWDIGDVVFSPDTYRYAYVADGNIYNNGIQKPSLRYEYEFAPVVDNRWVLMAYVWFTWGMYAYNFWDSQITLDQPYIIKPILSQLHYILYNNDDLLIDGVKVTGFNSTNPHGINSCWDDVFFLENIRPIGEDSQLFMWDNGITTIDTTYQGSAVFSPDCNRLAYLQRYNGKLRVHEVFRPR